MHDDPRNVVTQHNDDSRTGAYPVETQLTPGNVRAGSFGKLYEREVSGDIYAQPLYARGVQTRHGVKNLVFVATSTNTVYAFDADEPNTNPRAGVIWKQMLDPVRPLVRAREICTETIGSVGITSTPVIDIQGETIYLVTRLTRPGPIAAGGDALYQMHNDGTIWRYTGPPLTGWQLLDNNPATTQIVTNGSDLYQRHLDGKIWHYIGPPMTGWQLLDNNPATIQIVANDHHLYQLHDDGTIWVYTGPPMTGWQLLDNNPATMEIVASGSDLYQLHNDGSIWKYTGPPMTGWQLLDHNPATLQIAAGGGQLYQLHNSGRIWKYTGPPITGWQLIDTNPATIQIAANNTHVYQQHNNGRIWVYTGPPITGWQLLDNNGKTIQIAAAGNSLYQVHDDGTIWRYTGPPLTGWQMLDNNPAANGADHYLHALNIADGSHRHPPVRIQATDPHHPNIRFDSRCQRNRPGLLLLNGVVYLAFATFSCDAGCPDGSPYRGWVMGYRTSDLHQVAVFCTSPDGSAAGIWQSGNGLVGANDGTIYFETGNDEAPAQLGDAFVRLKVISAWPGFESPAHFFRPTNNDVLRAADTDLGAGGPMLLPGDRLIGGGKQGRFYVLDPHTMHLTQNTNAPNHTLGEGFQAFYNTWHLAGGPPPQIPPPYPIEHYAESEPAGPNIHGGPVYWQGTSMVYKMPEKDFLKAFHYDRTTRHVQEKPAARSQDRPDDGMPGGFSSISANGNRDGIVWVSRPNGDGQWTKVTGTLLAFDATPDAAHRVRDWDPGAPPTATLPQLKELWRTQHDGMFAKFCPPTVADGRVYLATFSPDIANRIPARLIVYGLLHWHFHPPSHAVAGPEGLSAEPPADSPPGDTASRSAILQKQEEFGMASGLLKSTLAAGSLPDGGQYQHYRDYTYGDPRQRASVTVPSADDPTCHQPPNATKPPLDSSIYWSEETGAHVVLGDIRRLWMDQRATASELGYPTSDEMDTPDGRGRMSQFQHGEIHWYPDRGATVRMGG